MDKSKLIKLELEDGNVKPFQAKANFAHFLFFGDGTLTLHYSADDSHYDEELKQFTIPPSGSINIEADLSKYSYYKITTTGSLTGAYIKYE